MFANYTLNVYMESYKFYEIDEGVNPNAQRLDREVNERFKNGISAQMFVGERTLHNLKRYVFLRFN